MSEINSLIIRLRHMELGPCDEAAEELERLLYQQRYGLQEIEELRAEVIRLKNEVNESRGYMDYPPM